MQAVRSLSTNYLERTKRLIKRKPTRVSQDPHSYFVLKLNFVFSIILGLNRASLLNHQLERDNSQLMAMGGSQPAEPGSQLRNEQLGLSQAL